MTKLISQLLASCANPPQLWSPSPAPPEAASRPPSAQATRKSRAAGIGSSSLNPSNQNSRSSTPVNKYASGSGNEAFFERMGNSNATRPEHLPPSQGGRYAGSGSTPEIPGSNSHPSFALSSQSAPTLDEFQKNPLGALTKGWGLFSSAVATAGKEINETVVRPGIGKASELAGNSGGEEWQKYLDGAKQAAGWAGQRAGEGWESFNEVARAKGGVDLNEQLGKLGLGKTGAGYGQLERAEDGVLTPHAQGADDDFFEAWGDEPTAQPPVPPPKPAAAKKNDGWQEDEWNDF